MSNRPDSRAARSAARNLAEDRPRFERAARDRIVALGGLLMARYGRHAMTLANFTGALGITPAAFRRHFADLDALLCAILRTHLHTLTAAVAAIPDHAPDRDALRRATYIALTRAPEGGFIEAHTLLLRDRYLLPKAEREAVEADRGALGRALAGPQAGQAFALMDIASFDSARVEAALAALQPGFLH